MTRPREVLLERFGRGRHITRGGEQSVVRRDVLFGRVETQRLGRRVKRLGQQGVFVVTVVF